MKRLPGAGRQRGGFLIGLVVGLLVGLAAALGVALYVTKAPIPFINKVPSRPATLDAAETEKNRNWDPNSSLAGHNPAPVPASAPASGVPAIIPPPDTTPAVATTASSAAPTRSVTAASSVTVTSTRAASQPASPLTGVSAYFVQAGAFARTEDAEQQRAKLALLGVESRLTEREQAGRMVYRVRVGPFDRKEDADEAKARLSESGVESAIVAVTK